MRKAFADTMLEVGVEDPALVVLVGDISHFALQPFAKACPGRFFNVGILEPSMVNMAAGLSISGMRPVVHTIAPFLIERSFEQIKLDFCYQEVGGTLISVGAAFDYSGLGCSHHTYNDLALMKALPNTEVVYPAMPNEFNLLFRECYQSGKLSYFRLPSDKHGVALPEERIKLGKGIRVKPGRDVTILAAGPRLRTAMDSLALLSSKDIDAEVLYFPTLKPFDSELLRESVARTGRLVVIEEHSKFGGFGEDALQAVVGLGEVSYGFVNIPDTFQRGYGQYAEHLTALGFTSANVAAICERLVQRGARK